MPNGITIEMFNAWAAHPDDEGLVEQVFDFCHFDRKFGGYKSDQWRSELLPGFEVVCAPWWLMSEIINGGFCQFLWNSESGASNRDQFAGINGTLRALRRLELDDIEQLLIAAIELYDTHPEISGYDVRWRSLDNAFYQIHDQHPIEQTLARYFRSHPADFVVRAV